MNLNKVYKYRIIFFMNLYKNDEKFINTAIKK